MTLIRNSIRNVLDGDMGFSISSSTPNANLEGIFINSATQLPTIDNIVSNYREFNFAANGGDDNAAGFDAIQYILRDEFNGLPDGHNIELSNGNLSTYGLTNGLLGTDQGLRHHYHTAQFTKAVTLVISLPADTEADYGSGGAMSNAGMAVGQYAPTNISMDDYRQLKVNHPTVEYTGTGGWFSGLGALIAQGLLRASGSATTGYPHTDGLDEEISSQGPIGLGGYADGIFIPGLLVDTQYI